MSDIICVTNRKLCMEDFFERIEKIASSQPGAIILREKDLKEADYKELSLKVSEICGKHSVKLILHNFVRCAIELQIASIHLPLPVLRNMKNEDKGKFTEIGASCHSKEEAAEAEALGCTYITAGHIFETDCKKDLEPRGLRFLKAVCEEVNIPVFAIGGIDGENYRSVLKAGASGACVMSGFMKCADPSEYIKSFKIK